MEHCDNMEYVFNKSKIIKNALKSKYRHSGNIVFWLKNTDMISVAQTVLSTLDKYNRAVLPNNIEIIRNTPVRKRLLFRIKTSIPTQKSLVVKVLNVHLLRLRFKYCWMKYHRYGFAETANLIIARNRGINVPRVYGYGRINGPFGLIEKDIVILEDLNHHISISELLEQNKKNEQKCINIIDSVIPILISHYKAGCNNWDINQGSIMFDQQDSELGPIALDLEYVVFHDKPSLEVLMFLAARLAWHLLYAADWMNKEIFYPWANKLLGRAEIRDIDVRKKFMERFDYWLNISYIPHKERMKVT